MSMTVIFNAKNRGFAAGCNQGARLGRAPFILFLNPDVFVRPDTIAAAVSWFNDVANSHVGVIGIQLHDREGNISCGCARRPTSSALLLRTTFIGRIFPSLVPPHFLCEWDHIGTREVDQVMVRRAIFRLL